MATAELNNAPIQVCKCGWESSRIDLAINSFIKVTELSKISNEIKQVISTKDENTSVDNLGQIQNNLI